MYWPSTVGRPLPGLRDTGLCIRLSPAVCFSIQKESEASFRALVEQDKSQKFSEGCVLSCIFHFQTPSMVSLSGTIAPPNPPVEAVVGTSHTKSAFRLNDLLFP